MKPYYHLIYKLHSNFSSCPNNVLHRSRIHYFITTLLLVLIYLLDFFNLGQFFSLSLSSMILIYFFKRIGQLPCTMSPSLGFVWFSSWLVIWGRNTTKAILWSQVHHFKKHQMLIFITLLKWFSHCKVNYKYVVVAI